MATKDKFSFSIDGVKYTDIKGSVWGEGIYISVGGTSQMILQWMKQKYPNLPKTNYYWIKSSSFANGNSIDIYLNEAPQEFVSKLRSELKPMRVNASITVQNILVYKIGHLTV
jgi:20S proteasome alpha/beta subunit